MPKGTAKNQKRVVGLGGIFFKAKDPDSLSRWYKARLGLNVTSRTATFTWTPRRSSKNRKVGYTVWSIFPAGSTYFSGKEGTSKQRFMVNYRVRDLKALLKQLRREGVMVDKRVEEYEYGKFGWVTDPEGNRIELWEPVPSPEFPEKSMPME